MKHKGHILFWTDVLLAVSFVLLAVTGAVMRWVLPPGTGGRHGGRAAGRELLNMSRHDFGDVHFWIAGIMVLLVLLHLALHWGWIRASTQRIVGFHPHPQLHEPRAVAAAPSHERS